MSFSFLFVPTVLYTEQVLYKCLLIWNLGGEWEAEETENSHSSISKIQCHNWQIGQIIFLFLQNEGIVTVFIQLHCHFPGYYSFWEIPCYANTFTENNSKKFTSYNEFIFLYIKRKTNCKKYILNICAHTLLFNYKQKSIFLPLRKGS